MGVARVFQSNTAFDTLSALENVLVGTLFGSRDTLPLVSRKADHERAMDAIQRVGLDGKEHVLAADLTVLDRKRLMFASALATNPRILMMDEPVGGLTVSEIEEIAVLTETLKSAGMTIVIIEHVMKFMVRLSSRILILHHGAEIFEGPPDGMLRDPTVTRVYLGEAAAEALSKTMSPGVAV